MLRSLLTSASVTVALLAFSGSASAETRTFVNDNPINPIDPAPSSVGYDPAHFPSRIGVAGLPGSITNVKVKLFGVSSLFPPDIDVLLVSPGGRGVLLMSDAGIGSNVSFANLGFRDDAPGRVPLAGPFGSGDYRPTNFGDNDFIPQPAPQGPYGTTLASLAGAEPNGKWRLYVIDDAPGDAQHIAGGGSITVTSTGGKIVRDADAIYTAHRASANAAPGVPDRSPATLDV